MNKIVHYLFVLCLFMGMYGCSDDDRNVKRIYPEEKQVPFEKEDVKGYLHYSKEYKDWIIYPAWDDNSGFQSGFEDNIVFFIDNMKDEYKAYEGNIVFGGTFLYLYYEANLPMNGCNGGTDIYSLKLKNIQKREMEGVD